MRLNKWIDEKTGLFLGLFATWYLIVLSGLVFLFYSDVMNLNIHTWMDREVCLVFTAFAGWYLFGMSYLFYLFRKDGYRIGSSFLMETLSPGKKLLLWVAVFTVGPFMWTDFINEKE